MKRFGPYLLRGALGRGGMAVVLDARHDDGREVALKLMRVRPSAIGTRLSKRFLREAKLLHELDDPNIVKLYDYGQVEDILFIALERIMGSTLHAICHASKLDCDTLLHLGERLAMTLHRLHGTGIVHRDVKPANVLVDRVGCAKLIDFGIATSSNVDVITRANDILGTMGYIAPELIEGGTPTPQVDQYSLGRVLVTMASGEVDRAVNGDRVKRMVDGLAIDWSAFPRSPRWASVQAVIQRMVAIDPASRYPDLLAVSQAMAELRNPRTHPEAVLGVLSEIAARKGAPASTMSTPMCQDAEACEAPSFSS
jgi:eukaryotic-like serine/threonine-protein kinase